MAIKGSLKEASLPDVIQLLALGRKTGCLAVADRQNFGYIYFRDGRIVYASIVNRRDRIGDILVRNSRISQTQLQQAIEMQENFRERKLGDLLVATGAISRHDLELYMRLQIEEAVYYLFTWTSGTFNFEAGVAPEREDFLVAINPESLLLEGARRVDEWSLIEKKIPSLDLVFAVDREHLAAAEVTLATEQEKILPLLDGARDVYQVVEESGLSEFDVGKALYGLVTAGFIRRVGTSIARPVAGVHDARVEEHRNLGIAFFKTGMLEESLREFRRVAELRPADGSACFYMGLLALKRARWEEAAEQFRHAIEKGGPRPSALHNLAFALEQLDRLEEAETTYGEAAARARDDARIMIGWSIVALRRGDHAVAGGRLARARELVGNRPVPGIWYWAMALAQAAGDELEAAIATAREGVQAFPGHPVLRNNLAVLLEAIGEGAEAETMLRAAFAEEPTLPQVSKNLGDLLYRAGRYDDAFDAYERAVKLAPELGDDVWFKLGNIAYKRRERVRARTCWERVVSLNPGHELARSNLELLGAET